MLSTPSAPAVMADFIINMGAKEQISRSAAGLKIMCVLRTSFYNQREETSRCRHADVNSLCSCSEFDCQLGLGSPSI
ncbi:hypothetical protein [Paenibacillus sp. JJ-100]|uniref:hypothetical protein n=1 Tax=Paenibacillus sp. JJ-100 TaxID=2974896 RepID=UPI00232D5895|nr:hypothetical protein [Paenibacillus sp. JJ-100]